jgi:hypothetical protein
VAERGERENEPYRLPRAEPPAENLRRSLKNEAGKLQVAADGSFSYIDAYSLSRLLSVRGDPP